jgi:hypothetical protein
VIFFIFSTPASWLNNNKPNYFSDDTDPFNQAEALPQSLLVFGIKTVHDHFLHILSVPFIICAPSQRQITYPHLDVTASLKNLHIK